MLALDSRRGCRHCRAVDVGLRESGKGIAVGARFEARSGQSLAAALGLRI